MTACSDPTTTEPAAVEEETPLTDVMPDLAPEAGTEGTDRYVPVLQRIARRAINQIREKRGDEAAGKVIAAVRELQSEISAAREADDAGALEAARRKLEAYSARLGLRVFGPRLARHVAASASKKLAAVVEELRAAQEAGQDVTRLAQGARRAHQHLSAAREAWRSERHVAALVHAAHALDLATAIDAAL